MENWNGQHTYGELKRFTDAGESAWFNSDGTNAVKEITAEQQWDGTYQLHVVGTDDGGNYSGTYGKPDLSLDFDVYVAQGSEIPPLAFRYKDKSVCYDKNYGGVKFELENDAWDIATLCTNGALYLNDVKLTYSTSSYISYVDNGSFVKSGQSLFCKVGDFSEGENTVRFVNPDQTECSITVAKTTVSDGWYNSYTVEQVETAPAAQTLYVRLVGSFENMIAGQETAVDAVSSATTGASSYTANEATAWVEYALVEEGTARDEVPEESWQKPDYFKNGGELQIDGTKSCITISPEGSGLSTSFNVFNGDVILSGTAAAAGAYEISVHIEDGSGRSADSNALPFTIYSGSETLSEQLTLEHCTQTADGKYMYDMEPWYITAFGGEDETVTVPQDIKAWYGSHGALPTPNYGELGETISLTNGEEPTQTLIIPAGCNLTMVNLRIHSGVKVIVEAGAKLSLRQSILEGIAEVYGSFSMDYNDYGGGEWLHGSAVNGQLRLMDGATLDHARIDSHTNYSARDDENRRNAESVVTVEGEVTLQGDAYILGDEAPTGETGQSALRVSGTLHIPAGSTLAVYGGGESNLTAVGGDALLLDGGTLTGAGNLIAVGGFATNTTADTDKGSGGAAVRGDGTINLAKAYLEGGSCGVAASDAPGEALSGDVTLTDTTNYKLVQGSARIGETSPQYWHGTGDSNGTIPMVEATLALVPENAPAGVRSGKTAAAASVVWSGSAPANAAVTFTVSTRDGETVGTADLTAENDWTATIDGLDADGSYVVEATSGAARRLSLAKGAQDDTWAEGQLGGVEENTSYLVTYEDDGTTYMLGVQDGALGNAEWNGEAPGAGPEGFLWTPVFANDDYGWYLMNCGMENAYLSMKQSGFEYAPVLYARSGDYDYYNALRIDSDGSIWSNNYQQQFVVQGGTWSTVSTDSSDFTVFTFHALTPSATERFTINAVGYSSYDDDDDEDDLVVTVKPASEVPVALSTGKSYAEYGDLNTTGWYRSDVEWALKTGVMNGVSEDSFAPDENASRASVVTMLWRMAGQPAAEGSTFRDVDENSWYGAAVRWACAQGIVDGYGDGSFGPNGVLTREQLVTILYRASSDSDANAAEGAELSAFADADGVSVWALDAMRWACANGILNGTEGADGALLLRPTAEATRAELAAILHRLSE
ncbi:MAG: S-layer homology domain-containing protein [Oscillospiraceae bacterium]|nr:S-layer homology domain-containing protein [Oscillospiraceae bacterium]